MRKVNEKPRVSAAVSGGRHAMVRASPHVQASRGTSNRRRATTSRAASAPFRAARPGMRRNRVTTIRPESGSTREVAGGPRTRAASATPGSAWWCGGGACPPACYLPREGPWERGAVLISAWERPPRRIEWPRNRGASIFDYTVIEVSSLTITSRRRPMALKAASIRSSRERCCTSSTRSTCGRCQPRRRASSALPMPCSLMPR